MRQHVPAVPLGAQQDRQQSSLACALGAHAGPASGYPTGGCLPVAEFLVAGVTTVRLAGQRLSHSVLRDTVQADQRVSLDPRVQQRKDAAEVRGDGTGAQLRLSAQGGGVQRGGQ